jgi:hypothetical protein
VGRLRTESVLSRNWIWSIIGSPVALGIASKRQCACLLFVTGNPPSHYHWLGYWVCERHPKESTLELGE